MDGLRSKLGAHAIFVDIAVETREGAEREDRKARDIEFLARLEDFKRDQSERSYPRSGGLDIIPTAEFIEATAIDFGPFFSQAPEKKKGGEAKHEKSEEGEPFEEDRESEPQETEKPEVEAEESVRIEEEDEFAETREPEGVAEAETQRTEEAESEEPARC